MGPRCCICGSRDDVAFCDDCQHNFCGFHGSDAWGVWARGAAYLKQHLLGLPPDFCDGHAEGANAA